MIRIRTVLLATLAMAAASAPAFVHADSVKPVSCSVKIDYKVNGALRYPYAQDFVVTPGTPFEHDFSTFTRERFFTATAREGADGRTTVDIGYYNDVGVFEYVDLGTSVTVRNEREETTTGTSSYYTSLGTAGEHTSEYTLACHVLKD